MIKSKFGLFTQLAILFAILSAFTTNQQKKFYSAYAVWGIFPGYVSNNYYSPADFEDLQFSVTDVLFQNISPIWYWGYSDLEEFREEYNDGELACYSYSNYVCMAYVCYNMENPTEGVVIDLIEGDYEHII